MRTYMVINECGSEQCARLEPDPKGALVIYESVRKLAAECLPWVTGDAELAARLRAIIGEPATAVETTTALNRFKCPTCERTFATAEVRSYHMDECVGAL
jgi:hypothetical protein